MLHGRLWRGLKFEDVKHLEIMLMTYTPETY